MTEDEAVKAVYDFRAGSQWDAQAKCDEINAQLEQGKLGPMVTVNFGAVLGWGCMLRDSAEYMGLYPQHHHIVDKFIGN